jgi:hypothetical protein
VENVAVEDVLRVLPGDQVDLGIPLGEESSELLDRPLVNALKGKSVVLADGY